MNGETDQLRRRIVPPDHRAMQRVAAAVDETHRAGAQLEFGVGEVLERCDALVHVADARLDADATPEHVAELVDRDVEDDLVASLDVPEIDLADGRVADVDGE